jgi:hypothetical protein
MRPMICCHPPTSFCLEGMLCAIGSFADVPNALTELHIDKTHRRSGG